LVQTHKSGCSTSSRLFHTPPQYQTSSPSLSGPRVPRTKPLAPIGGCGVAGVPSMDNEWERVVLTIGPKHIPQNCRSFTRCFARSRHRQRVRPARRDVSRQHLRSHGQFEYPNRSIGDAVMISNVHSLEQFRCAQSREIFVRSIRSKAAISTITKSCNMCLFYNGRTSFEYYRSGESAFSLPVRKVVPYRKVVRALTVRESHSGSTRHRPRHTSRVLLH